MTDGSSTTASNPATADATALPITATPSLSPITSSHQATITSRSAIATATVLQKTAPPSLTPCSSSQQATPAPYQSSTPQPCPSSSGLDRLQTSVTFIPLPPSENTTPQGPVPTNPRALTSSSSTNTSKVASKPKHKSPPINSEQATNEFLKTELNAAQAQIVMLDATIKDKDQELSVLWARIKIFEEKQNQEMLDHCIEL